MKTKAGSGEWRRAIAAMILISIAIFLAHRFAEAGTTASAPLGETASGSINPNPPPSLTGGVTRKNPHWRSPYEDLPAYMLEDRIAELESALEDERWARLVAEERNHEISEELERLNSDLSEAKYLTDGWTCAELRGAISGIEEALATH